MNTIKEVILTGITFTLVGLGLPAQASELILQANVEPEMSWQVQGRGGLNVGTFAHQLNCSDCDRLQANGGPVLGLDVIYDQDGLLMGATGELGAVVFTGEQLYSGLLFGQSKEVGFLKTTVFAEAGVHGVNGFVAGIFAHSTRGSDWAILPYAGARLNADITLVEEIDLTLGLWSAIRMDLIQREQKVEVNAGLFRNEDDTEMRTYRVGGLQAAGGLQLGMAF
jgi:hypothetical protein